MYPAQKKPETGSTLTTEPLNTQPHKVETMFANCKAGPRPTNRHARVFRSGAPLAGPAVALGVLLAFSVPALAGSGSESDTPLPNIASRACVLAETARSTGKYQSAIELYTQCLDASNLSAERRATVLTNRGNVYFHLGEQETATADFDSAIELKPDLAVAYYNRGLATFVIGRYDDAIADSSEAIRIDPTMAAAYYNRGAAYANQRRFEKAVADLSEAIRLRPDWALAYSARGDAYLRSGDAENGARDHAEAARLDPSLSEPAAR